MKTAVKCAVASALFGILAITNANGQDQKFKLPSFAPFKKEAGEIKPIQLTDTSPSRPDYWPSAPLKSGPLAEFGQKSREFFQKTGDDLSKFSMRVRDSFRMPESPGWGEQKPNSWWNDTPDAGQLYSDLNRLGFKTRQTPTANPPAPVPDRTAHGWPVSPPKFRF